MSNILRNWALMPGSERLLAEAACVHALAHALEAVSHDSGPAAAELAGNLLDVLQQVWFEHDGSSLPAHAALAI